MLSEHHLPHSGRCAVQEHGALIDCLARSDMASAAAQMAHHLTAVADRALKGQAPIRSEPIRSEPIRSEPIRSEPIRSEPGRGELLRAEAKPEPASTEPG
jgi:hypothetical protein